jgi:hypothetical protein
LLRKASPFFNLDFNVKLQLKQTGQADHVLNLHYSWLREASPFYLDFIVKLQLKQAGVADHGLNLHYSWLRKASPFLTWTSSRSSSSSRQVWLIIVLTLTNFS